MGIFIVSVNKRYTYMGIFIVSVNKRYTYMGIFIVSMLFGVQIDSVSAARKPNMGEVILQIPPSLYHCIFGVVRFRCLFTILSGRPGRDHMVVGFITTCAISAYHHQSCVFESHSWRGVLDTTLCDKVCH